MHRASEHAAGKKQARCLRKIDEMSGEDALKQCAVVVGVEAVSRRASSSGMKNGNNDHRTLLPVQ